MGPLRLVLDTNVVMALWHFRDPKLAPLAAWLGAGRAEAITRPECLDELQRVLAYEQFRIEPVRQAEILTAYRARAQCVDAASEAELAVAATLPRCRDRDDQKFIGLAWDTDAHAIVTRDKLLLKLARRTPLRERFGILTPERLCQMIAPLMQSETTAVS